MKVGDLILSMKFLCPDACPYLYRSTTQPCVENCCHGWADILSYYLDMLDKLQKLVLRTGRASLNLSLELSAHCLYTAS